MVDLSHNIKTKSQFLAGLNKQIDELRKTDYAPGFDDAFRARVCAEYKARVPSLEAAQPTQRHCRRVLSPLFKWNLFIFARAGCSVNNEFGELVRIARALS